jgi:hypothetical protein
VSLFVFILRQPPEGLDKHLVDFRYF